VQQRARARREYHARVDIRRAAEARQQIVRSLLGITRERRDLDALLGEDETAPRALVERNPQRVGKLSQLRMHGGL